MTRTTNVKLLNAYILIYYSDKILGKQCMLVHSNHTQSLWLPLYDNVEYFELTDDEVMRQIVMEEI